MKDYEKFSRFLKKRSSMERGFESSQRGLEPSTLRLMRSLAARDGISVADLVAAGGPNLREVVDGLDLARKLGLIQVEDGDHPTARLTEAGKLALRDASG